ncbi:MAG: cobalamin B12-binding domain-containing protein [Elusimicrobia bacterium]|nr:cobalamin B12-binding domain-containing protein [Elusimicrobiota bacterium]
MAATGNGEPLPARWETSQLELGESRRRAAFLKAAAGLLARGPRPLRKILPLVPSDRKPARPRPRTGPAQAKVLLFRNPFQSGPGGEPDAGRLHGATFCLASSLKAEGVPVVLSDLKLSRLDEKGPCGLAGLSKLLERHPDITLVGLTLYDSCFEPSRRLLAFLRSRTRAFLAVGGIMPTLSPEETFVHLPQAHLVVRGAGEEVLPALARVLGPSDASSPLSEARREALAALDGVLSSDAGGLVWAAGERVSRVADLDRSVLDLSLLGKEDASLGLCLCLSRGCCYGCAFCASMDRGRFHGRSPEAVASLLASYGRRLKELYGSWSRVPPGAFGIGFYDDDFLADPGRAKALFSVLKRSPFFVLFIQTAVNSFFRKRAGRPTDELDAALLDALDPGLFTPKVGGASAAPADRPWVYIGTESFCDLELKRLGKGYDCARAAKAALALSRRGIRQAHHLIAANAETRLEDLVEGLGRIVRLQALCGEPFAILGTPTPHLVSFYPTASYRRLIRLGLRSRIEVRETLRLKGFPLFDYPLVARDMPEDPDVREFCLRAGRGELGPWRSELEALLLTALKRSEELALSGRGPGRSESLRRCVDLFHLPPASGDVR